ncbi:MAG: hypothetical protein KDE19_14350 [Caldilineaceae bacterium]|nr:hypothetical protein [Caldilineaceae bacterium]
MQRKLFLAILLLIAAGLAIRNAMPAHSHPAAIGVAGVALTVATPQALYSQGGRNDGRDVDIYPAIAYAPTTDRYLAIWLSAQNAGSAEDGLDLYGRFLDGAGQPNGNAFRISDRNTVARNGSPVLVPLGDGFLVVWTARGTRCQLSMQYVTDSSAKTDQTLSSGSTHHHSPALAVDPSTQQATVAFVSGDDYLPPTMMGAATGDCGDQVGSTAQIGVKTIHLTGSTPSVGQTLTVSTGSGGTFRPSIAFAEATSRYLVGWEDRRDGAGQPYRFDLYAQELAAAGTDPTVLTTVGNNVALATGGDYTNLNTSAHWTPRPALAAGESNFLVTWFARDPASSFAKWQVVGRLVTSSTAVGAPVTLMQMLYTQPHPGDAPQGYLRTVYVPTLDEFLVGMTVHLETFFGYFSSVQVQRVQLNGDLLTLAGEPQAVAGNGAAVDYALETQLALGMAVRTAGPSSAADVAVVYGKHAAGGGLQDFDIWGVRLAGSAASTTTTTPTGTATAAATPFPTGSNTPTFTPTVTTTELPLATNSATPTVTSTGSQQPTVTPSPTPTLSATPTVTGKATEVSRQLYLPFVHGP